jgi:2Fe-2S ferredoxin
MPRIRFVRRNGDVVVTAPVGTDLLRAALDAEVGLASSCGGEGTCKACRVEVLSGAERLSAPTERERGALAAAKSAPNERLACAARLMGDVEITTSYW